MVTPLLSIVLPYPPSQHRLWVQRNGSRGKALTKEYEAWRADADHALLTQVGKLPRLDSDGPLAVHATVFKGKGWTPNGDGDNRLKAPVDWLVDRGILEDDSWEFIDDWRISLDKGPPLPRALMRLTLSRSL